MLDEFVEDLREVVATRLQTSREKLEAHGGDERHDLVRGHIAALKEIDREIVKLAENFRAPESVPENIAQLGGRRRPGRYA